MKAISFFSNAPGSFPANLDSRVRAVLVFWLLGSVFFGFSSLLLQFGFPPTPSELMPILESGITSETIIALASAALLITSIFIFRHFWLQLLLSFFRSLRTVFKRFLRALQPPTPALCPAHRSAHASRAPPFRA
ncbi:hypothetical protein [Microbulbifer pacificus]|uniref:hypothetical protein n=1 Tax=Microbulbifer pacificus TaxID=407164 RepID=UPI00131A42CB|nr:hypothetical protein [Microbulbifer pacificus]